MRSEKWMLALTIGVGMLALSATGCKKAPPEKEHGGKEHVGATLREHSGSLAFAEPSAEELRQTIRDYIQWHERSLGSFTVPDPKEKGRLRTLELVRVHERVGKTGDYYYSCTDMKDVATGDELDLDFDISDTGKELKVAAVRIHKDNGTPRYTYDANDNLVSLSE